MYQFDLSREQQMVWAKEPRKTIIRATMSSKAIAVRHFNFSENVQTQADKGSTRKWAGKCQTRSSWTLS